MLIDYTSVAAALTGRQAALYTHRCTIWRRVTTITAGSAALTWEQVGENVPLRVFPSPSQFMLQMVVQAEGDNVFTLDILDFPQGVDVGPGDTLKLTAGPASMLHGFWTIRGDVQPLTYRANVLRYIAARNSGDQAPAGVS